MKPLIIASYGRCGTNLLRRMVKDNYKSEQYCDMNTKFEDDNLYITHDYCKEVKGIKAIFIYGHPLNTIISTHSDRLKYKKEHYEKFNANYGDDWINKDVLDLEGRFDSWYKGHDYPILFLKYETLYKHLETISVFIWSSLTFIPEKKRKTDYKTYHSDTYRLLNTYKNIIIKYEKADECRIINNSN